MKDGCSWSVFLAPTLCLVGRVEGAEAELDDSESESESEPEESESDSDEDESSLEELELPEDELLLLFLCGGDGRRDLTFGMTAVRLVFESA